MACYRVTFNFTFILMNFKKVFSFTQYTGLERCGVGGGAILLEVGALYIGVITRKDNLLSQQGIRCLLHVISPVHTSEC